MKTALITGITGQDGSYLAEFLIKKGYKVYGLMRRTSTDPFMRIEDLYIQEKLHIIYGNMRDKTTLTRALIISKPDEIYNLAAQSHVGVSFDCPEETEDINFRGMTNLVTEAFRLNQKVRIYQASTSEMYGNTPPPQNEKSPLCPVSPYGESKTRAHYFAADFRKKNKAFIACGILFNHESPRRGKHFVTRKLTYSFAKIKLGLQKKVTIGNLDAERDWGFAGDYVEAMWMMLQQDTPDDYVIATGKSRSVREFAQIAAGALGIKLTWSGKGLKEVGKDSKGNILIEVSKKYYRPHEVNYLLGDATKAAEKLGWEPKTSFDELVKMMAEADLTIVANTKTESSKS